jgi:hypothetical protein
MMAVKLRGIFSVELNEGPKINRITLQKDEADSPELCEGALRHRVYRQTPAITPNSPAFLKWWRSALCIYSGGTTNVYSITTGDDNPYVAGSSDPWVHACRAVLTCGSTSKRNPMPVRSRLDSWTEGGWFPCAWRALGEMERCVGFSGEFSVLEGTNTVGVCV